jgi:hypothetical protein
MFPNLLPFGLCSTNRSPLHQITLLHCLGRTKYAVKSVLTSHARSVYYNAFLRPDALAFPRYTLSVFFHLSHIEMADTFLYLSAFFVFWGYLFRIKSSIAMAKAALNKKMTPFVSKLGFNL